MAGMGPPPKRPEARARTNQTFAQTRLPAEGRRGRAPAWPLPLDVVLAAKRDLARRRARIAAGELEAATATEAQAAARLRLDAAQDAASVLDAQLRVQTRLERVLWSAAWKTPQAVAWDRLGWRRDVAQYVRHKARAEAGDLDAAREARQWSDRLGLNPLAMLRLRWEVAPDEVAVRRARVAAPVPATASARARYARPVLLPPAVSQ